MRARWPRSPRPTSRSSTGSARWASHHAELDEGLELLADVVAHGRRATCPGRLVADLKIARGLDYYTGTVYETELVGFESLGIDLLRRPLRLAGQRRPDHLSRGRAVDRGHPAAGSAARPRAADARPGRCPPRCWSRSTPRRPGPRPIAVAEQLRARGIASEVAPEGRQVRPADPLRRPARHPLRLVRRGRAAARSRTSARGDQTPADPATWHRRRRIGGRGCWCEVHDLMVTRDAVLHAPDRRPSGCAGNAAGPSRRWSSLLACVQSQEYAPRVLVAGHADHRR